jgi:nitroreductase
MDFLSLAKARHSVRKYDVSRPVEQDKLDYVMECVRMAPSAVNYQPWKFYIAKEATMLDAVSSCYANEWLKTAPCIIVACVDHRQSWHRQRYDNKDHADIDIAIAVDHLCLAATEQGLGTCWICNFDADKCREVLQLDAEVEPAVLIPIGYAIDPGREKKRKNMDEIVLS